jgi:glycosyltransferase involved in cell wall biosynthesis
LSRVVLAYPGSLETRTGGYLYDRRLALELEALGWRVERLSLPAGFPFPTPATLEESAAALAALPDGTTVLVDGLAFGAMPAIAAREARRLDLVALVHHPLCLETGLAPAQASALAASERAALAGARAVIVTSPRTAASLVELFGVPAARLTVALPGTDPASLARGSGGPTCRMVCVATLTPRKGHLVLLEALAGLGTHPWELLCAGSTERDPKATAAVQAAITAHGLDDRVRLLGELDEPALEALWHAADLCVSPALYEGYGMALAEALSHGLPVVSSNAGAIPATVPADAGILVPPGDAAALADALRRVLTDAALRTSLTAAARTAASALPTWDDAVDRFVAELASIEPALRRSLARA